MVQLQGVAVRPGDWLYADADGIDCGLRLPGRDIAPGQGDVHRRQVLEVLALWP